LDAESKITPPGSQKSTDAALQLESVSKNFHTGGRSVRALDHISIEVRRGIVTGVPNKNSESGEKSRVLRFTALMSPAWVVPQDLLASQKRSANLWSIEPTGRFLKNLVFAAAAVSRSQFTTPLRLCETLQICEGIRAGPSFEKRQGSTFAFANRLIPVRV
jgi:hypothetical protein